MKNRIEGPAFHQAASALALCALAALLAGCGRCDGGKPHIVHGPLLVSYEIQHSPTEKSSSSGKQQEIQVFDECVILVSEGGKSSQLIPISKLNGMGWTKE